MKLFVVLLLNCFIIHTWCKNVAPRIVGGSMVQKRSDFAYQALLRYDGYPQCGGSIIDSKHVLTAASCFAVVYNNQVHNPKLSVAVGQIFLSDNKEMKEVDEVYIHENYTIGKYASDIALVRISGTFGSWTDNTKPIGLSNVSVTTGSCKVSGWGTTIAGSVTSSSQLKYATLPIVDWTTCWSKFYSLVLDDKMICAGGTGDITCLGDAGGPLVCDGKLAGIYSFGSGCGTTPHVFTEVAKYADWIEKTVKISNANSTSTSTSLQLSIGLFVLCVVSRFL